MTGCNDRAVVNDISWLEPIEFSSETKEWLGGLEWPSSAYEDFDKIRKLNLKIREIKKIK